jgi:uncharacterized protein YdhG (YjbR/CyaY superfamily)
MIQKQPKDTSAYIATFPKETQVLLQSIRSIIQKAAPKAEEVISYGMPAFKQNSVLVYFAGYQKHIGFYPTSSPIKKFGAELAPYKTSKGAVQFPLDKPIPATLVTRMVKYRVEQDMEKAMQKNIRICKNGHTYYKSSDCPTCPQCEKERKPLEGFLSILSAPARRALENAGIKTLKQLAKKSEAEVMTYHGMGPASLPKLRKALEEEGLQFKQSK